MKAFIEKDLRINYALHIGEKVYDKSKTIKQYALAPDTTSSCQ